MKTNSDHSSEFVIPISYGSTEVVETGKWGFQKPETSFMTAPCQESCPAGNPIPQFLYLAAEDRCDEALQALLLENPFPAVCGRVCFHPCEVDCNRGRYDESVSIRAMERYVGDTGLNQAPNLRSGKAEGSRRIAVVGAGPAGLSCAYFLSLLGHEVTIFERKKEPGGVLRRGIPGYRLPKSVLNQEIERIKSLAVKIETNVKVGEDIPFDELKRFDSIFLSPGAGLNRPLSIEGEDLKRVLKGGEFLERINSKDQVTLGKETIVIGGGNTAMDVARSARRLGSKVTVAYRRTRNEMPALRDEIVEAEEEGVGFEFLIQPVEVGLLRNRKLTVKFQRMKLRGFDQGGRPKAIPVKGKFFTLEADHLITAAGEEVDLSWIPQDFIKNSLIEVNPLPAVFAGGDAVDQLRTVVTAISAGKRAAISIDLRMKGETSGEVLSKIRLGKKGSFSMAAYLAGRDSKKWIEQPIEVVDYEKLNALFFEPKGKVRVRQLGHGRRLKNFSEVNIGFSSEEAVLSASRCFTCGTCNYCYNCYYFCPEGAILLDPARQTKTVDLEHCKGCGTCAKSCPRSAVEMKDVT